MEDDSIALLTQTFSLKHQDAAQLIEATTPILLGQPGRLARMGRDRTELVVNATRSELNRLSTLVTVLDFPEPIQSFPEAAGGYRDPLMLARAFLYACAIRDSASARRLVSAAQRAQLDSSSTPIEAYMDGWMRYPLKQLGLEPGVALGFVERHSVFAIYDESPASLVYLSVVGEPNPSNRPTAEDPNQGRPLWIDTAPPWLETDPSAPRALVPERIEPSSLPTPLPRE